MADSASPIGSAPEPQTQHTDNPTDISAAIKDPAPHQGAHARRGDHDESVPQRIRQGLVQDGRRARGVVGQQRWRNGDGGPQWPRANEVE